MRVPYSTKELAIGAKPQSALSTAALQAASAAQGELGSAEGAKVPFQSGDRLALAVAVTAQDGNTLRYLLDVRRLPPERNADLASLVPAAGVMTPPFSPRVVTYNLLRAHMAGRLREAESLMREVLANLGRLEMEDAP